ncbi:MAG: hypothetical protein HN580_19205 [Deltaproteobacteria bacterium]|nr:hypothetical protein [Deltaproteobacteria bacterium]MBT4262980.1 hypothetical protein [Deltaproteobacteria bacterium]MBT4638963.1 hypothetical protein [Deltaproteobacteria bacterium]MBT6504758.1 hypothetical protein [Deltaproteobacteria bacterium]MBT7152128.1 hypothetical protein [Deltaproteobacteria bacterium]
MFRRDLIKCLIVAMVCSMSVPVNAADISARINGRTRAWLENVAIKDGPSTTQIKADGRLGADIKAVSGSWTVTAYQDIDLDSDESQASPTIGEQKITLGTDNLDITLGRFSPYGVTKGMKYAIGPISDVASFWVGENLPTTDFTDHMVANLKDVGLKLIVGLNNYHAADSTTDARNEIVAAAVFGKEVGPVDLGVEVISASTTIDEKDSNAVKNGTYDGQIFSALALGIGYTISKTISVAFNFESNSNTAGTTGAEADKNSIMEIWFDFGLDDTSGISIGYGTKANDNGSANKGQSTLLSLSYLKRLGIAGLYANYLAATEKDDDTATDTATTTVAAGLKINF